MEQLNEQRLLQNDSFLKWVSLKYIVPSVLAMFALYAGALIDTIIVGFYLGEEGLSAMSLISPVYLLYYTLGATIGIGGSIAANYQIGKGNYEKYRQVFTCSLITMLSVAMVTTLLGLFLLNPFAQMLSGGSGHTEMVRDYLHYYIFGGGFTLLSYIPLYFLKTDGRPHISSALFFTFALFNVVLTWLFLSPVCSMGIGGAALATSLSMAVASVLGFVLLFCGRGETKLALGGLTRTNLHDIAVLGVPSGLANLLEALRILLINALLLRLGSSALLPTFTVVRNMLDLLGAVMIGISTALLPLISILFSEHDHVAVRTVFKNVMRIGLSTSLLSSLLVSLFPSAIATLFGITDPQVLAESRLALPLACAGTVFAYVNIQYTGYFNTIRRTGLSSLILSLRLVCYLLLIGLPISKLFGSVGIWLSFTLTEALTLVTCLAIRHILRKRTKSLDSLLLDNKYESEADISFSVKNTTEDIMFASNKITDFCEESGIDTKRTMKVSLAIEEILPIIVTKCMESDKEYFIDIRVRKLENEVMLRIRNAGKLFDPVNYYEKNKDNESMAEELLGLKLMLRSAELIDFRTTFGANNLMILF